MMIDTSKGVTAAQGFLASGVAAGLKKSGGKDIALVVSQGPNWDAAGVFTSNRFFAAPVGWSRQAISDGTLKAVVLNSGGANACTGAQGDADAEQMARLVAQAIEASPQDVGVASTGLIGDHLPMDLVSAGIAAGIASLDSDGGGDAAQAIMTTDTVSKQASYASDQGWSVGGMAKGAGMLAPALATMLIVITTDADLSDTDIQATLLASTHVSFDRADSDGCMSTNDTVLLLANGASGVKPDPAQFSSALTDVCVSLARQLIADAEGAEHSITVTATGAATEADALEVARSVARSNLFKCAIAGNDPNWGRVLASIGTTSATFDPATVDVAFNGVEVFHQGAPGRDRSEVDLHPFDVEVVISLNAGQTTATIWTNDLTHGYVSENSDYSS
ncbi:MAG: bifunctional glutamate N-acetyltransferase/amino-acid acetyltransferase ArgJ [Propionibacteriaceae bacterium]|jgi:glutamate N-acetyltransferase/amino-acid N-acetyltransferase|nr:bifunctional glutamate N-acetyltransferase/amino-acid acetyltransferase ArgJ [Propionibacteriaceae bacterium]